MMKLFKWKIKKPELILTRRVEIVLNIVGMSVLIFLMTADNFWIKVPATLIIFYIAFRIYRGMCKDKTDRASKELTKMLDWRAREKNVCRMPETARRSYEQKKFGCSVVGSGDSRVVRRRAGLGNR